MSYRLERSFSNRSLLANAYVDDMQNIFEKDLLIKYQDAQNQIRLNQEKLQEIREVLRGIHAGGSDVFSNIKKELQEEASSIASELDRLDRQLIELEQNPVVKNIIEHERQKLLQEMEQKAVVRHNEVLAKSDEKLEPFKEQSKTFVEVQEDKTEQKKHYKKWSLKEKLSETFGVVGGIAYFVISLIIYILPFVMIGGNFFVSFLLIGINNLIPLASAIFWIWGLVCAIKGVQDVWAIIYYILFVVGWIPFYISIIASIFKKK